MRAPAYRATGGLVSGPVSVDQGGCNNIEAVAAWTARIHERAFDLFSTGSRPVFLGGDHSLSIGTVSAAARHCGDTGRDLAVLWIDAHADFHGPATAPSGNMHGMP